MFLPLMKVDAVQRMFVARIDETPDRAGEVFDYATSKPEFEAWSGEISKATDGKSLGNVRVMHALTAVGTLADIQYDDVAKAIIVTGRVVDDATWAKVEAGVYTGISPGGKYLKTWQDGAHKRYTARPSEISLVDLPCIPSAHFTLVKAAGEEVEVPFAEPTLDARLAAAIGVVGDDAKTAALELLTKAAPAAPIDKVAALGDLKKYLGEQTWDAETALEALSRLYCLLGCEADEQASAPDQIAALKDAIQRIKDFIASEIQEPDAGMALAAKTGDLAKAAEGALAKVATLEADLAKVAAERDGLAKRVADLEALPAPGGARLKSLDKAADHGGATAADAAIAAGDDFATSLAKVEAMAPGPQRRDALNKLALSNRSISK